MNLSGIDPDFGLRKFIEREGYQVSERSANDFTLLYLSEPRSRFKDGIYVVVGEDKLLGAKARVYGPHPGVLVAVVAEQIRGYDVRRIRPDAGLFRIGVREVRSGSVDFVEYFLFSSTVEGDNDICVDYEYFHEGREFIPAAVNVGDAKIGLKNRDLPITDDRGYAVAGDNDFVTCLRENGHNSPLMATFPTAISEDKIEELEQKMTTDTEWLGLLMSDPILHYSRQ